MQMTGTLLLLFFLGGYLMIGLNKSYIKEILSRTTKKEKLISIGVVVLSVGIFFLVGSRMHVEELRNGYVLNDNVNQILQAIFDHNVGYITVFLYGVAAIPVLVMQAGIMERIAKKNTCVQNPFYHYLIVLCTSPVLYVFIARCTVVDILVWVLATAAIYWVSDLYAGRVSKKKIGYVIVLTLITCVICMEEHGSAIWILLWLVASLISLFVVSYIMKKGSVLRGFWRILLDVIVLWGVNWGMYTVFF